MHKALCLYPCGATVALIACLIGFFASAPIPEGRLFATLIPLVGGGYLPATIVGDEWWASRTPVPPVPSTMSAAARPSNEVMLALPGGGGDRMPALGLGLCCRPTAYDMHSVSRSVLWFLLKGGRHLDTAHLYLNHKAVGEGIRQAIARGVPRDEIFLTTKIVRWLDVEPAAAAVA